MKQQLNQDKVYKWYSVRYQNIFDPRNIEYTEKNTLKNEIGGTIAGFGTITVLMAIGKWGLIILAFWTFVWMSAYALEDRKTYSVSYAIYFQGLTLYTTIYAGRMIHQGKFTAEQLKTGTTLILAMILVQQFWIFSSANIDRIGWFNLAMNVVVFSPCQYTIPLLGCLFAYLVITMGTTHLISAYKLHRDGLSTNIDKSYEICKKEKSDITPIEFYRKYVNAVFPIMWFPSVVLYILWFFIFR